MSEHKSIVKLTRIVGLGCVFLGLTLFILFSSSILNNLNRDQESNINYNDPSINSRYISTDLTFESYDSFGIDPLEAIPEDKQGVIKINPNRKVVKFESNLTNSDIKEIEENYSVKFSSDSSLGNIYTINVTDESKLNNLISDYKVSLETDAPVKISSDNIDWGIIRIGADRIWDRSTGSGVVIAIIDTGVQLDHPDLKQNVVTGYNFVSNTTNANDDNGHGTHVAGIASAALNQIGTVGASHASKILPVKVLNNQGYGYLSDVAKGIYYAADSGARVINLSLGTSVDSKTLRDAVNYAASKGVLLVGAAGNDGGAPCSYPAAYNAVICVVATDNRNRLASFSNMGGELAAPGVSNYSTFIGSTYRYLSGTSMSSPHVAGAAAIVMSTCKDCSTSDVRKILQESAVDLGEVGKDVIFGYGLVDLISAMNSLQDPVEEPIDEPKDEPTQEPVTSEPKKPSPRESTKTQSQTVKIQEPQTNRGNKYIPARVEDITVKFTLSPIVENSSLVKTVVSLDNKEIYSTTKQSDEYVIDKELLNHTQHWLTVTSFFSDGKQSSDKLVIDMTYLKNTSITNINRGRSVLGISVSIFDWLKIF
jgi:subtilisin family serine protease